MKIALIGYGKMGKTIHELAKEKNEKSGENKYDISLIVDIDNRNTITKTESGVIFFGVVAFSVSERNGYGASSEAKMNFMRRMTPPAKGG